MLDPSTGSGQAWTTTLTGYDPHKRPVWTASKNTYLSTTDFVEIKLNFIGWAEEVKNIHQKTGQADLVVIEKFTYDHAGKVLVQTHQTNSTPAQRIADNTYDQLGQLKKKNVGGTTIQAALQNVDYAYNIRGWLKAINDVNNIGTVDLFAFKLGYNEGTSPLYNGNISLTQWKTRNTDSSLKTYNYTYDALNRITSAIDNTGKFNLTGLSYDKNGNILGLIRQGQVVENPNLALNFGYGAMDNLVYAYDSGNKLLKVTDNANDTYGFKDGVNTGDDFTYDVNGNMLSDANKGITGIVYNHLNLPTQVTMAGQNILYIYDAVGTKLRKTVSGITTDYAGNYVYENGVLQFFNTAEGYVEPNGTGWQYVYQYKDHLGNVRLSYADADGNGSINATTEILSEKNYYPFGLLQKGYNNVVSSNANSTAEKFTYNGKELNDELGLDVYDYGSRSYDPAIGRFFNMDRFSEKYNSLTPYHYTANNPILFIDVRGDSIVISGKAELVERYKNVVLKGTGGFYNANIDSNGNVSLNETGISNLGIEMTDEQKSFFQEFSNAINSEQKIEQEVVENADDVNVDSFVTGQIDIADVEEFDKSGNGGASSAGALIHSTTEQIEKAKLGLGNGDIGKVETDASGNRTFPDYLGSHSTAIKSENRVNGNYRGVGGNEDLFLENNGTKTLQTITPTKKGGIKITKKKTK